MAPWMRPAAPVPAIALPSINIEELGAVAHNVEPAVESSANYSRKLYISRLLRGTAVCYYSGRILSKTKIEIRYTVLTLNSLFSVPPAG